MPSHLEPGDLLLVQTHHFVSRLIRFGQRGYGPADAQWNHVAVYIGDDQLVEALTSGVIVSPLDKYPASDVRQVHVRMQLRRALVLGGGIADAAEAAMRGNACVFARSCVGEQYGFMTIAAIALKVLTRGRLTFGVQGTSICSGLAARALERLGYDWNPYDPAELTPAYLAKVFA